VDRAAPTKIIGSWLSAINAAAGLDPVGIGCGAEKERNPWPGYFRALT